MSDSKSAKLTPGQPIYKRSKPFPALLAEPPRQPSKPAAPESGQSAPLKGIDGERAYLLKHSAARTPMVVVLRSGAVLRGRLAWVDTYSIKIERQPAEPNVLVFKSSIDYLHREVRPV